MNGRPKIGCFYAENNFEIYTYWISWKVTPLLSPFYINWTIFSVTNNAFCERKQKQALLMKGKCRGKADKSIDFKLWCFWSAECGFESPAVTLVSLSKTLYHWFVLRMGRKAVGPMCCVTHVKEHSALIEKRRGSPRCPLLWLLNVP